jgi:hypothetical protein
VRPVVAHLGTHGLDHAVAGVDVERLGQVNPRRVQLDQRAERVEQHRARGRGGRHGSILTKEPAHG